mgnify:CR=1 FL=1
MNLTCLCSSFHTVKEEHKTLIIYQPSRYAFYQTPIPRDILLTSPLKSVIEVTISVIYLHQIVP